MKKSEKQTSNGRISKRKLIRASAVTIATAAFVIGSMFAGPSELTATSTVPDNPPAIVMSVDDFAVPENDEVVAEAKKPGRYAKLKAFILKLPMAVRVVVLLPLWAVGHVMNSAGAMLWGGVFSPVLSVVATFLLGIASLLGLFAVTAKLMFPNIPFKKIMSKRNITTVVIVASALVGADFLLPLLWEEYTFVSAFVKTAVALSVVAYLCSRLKSLTPEFLS